ncbi:MAG: peptidoglycan DD-metalloendopeptidase family protein [Betaproteobacteria bacterium]
MQHQAIVTAVQAWAQAHRRRLVWGLGAGLTGVAATAFGLAPLVPTGADLPQQTVTQVLQPAADVVAQLEALSDLPLELYRSDTTRKQDTAETLLTRLGVNDPQAAAYIRQDRQARKLLEGRPQKMVRAKADAAGRLIELVARYPAEQRNLADTHFTRLTLKRVDGAWVTDLETAELQSRVQLGSGTIRSSLFAATDEAQMPDAIASQMAEIFSGDIDFHRELKRGDAFSVVYETLMADGEPINWNQAAGRVLAAEFVNNGRVHQAVWFKDAQRGSYYDFGGKSKRRAFLASPMEFSRVTSGFAMRFHPIHQRVMAHTGVDYGAPVGTPARTVADGTVEFAGWQGGYGNTVVVRHGADKTTLYAHLSRIDVRRGERVQQGQRIGAVGATGTATGPHLHYEFRVNGRHVDPLKAARNAAPVPLSEQSRGAFMARAELLRTKLDVAATLVGDSGRGD